MVATTYEMSIQDSRDEKVYVEGILKGKMLMEDNWLIVKYEIYTTQQNNLLCEKMGYESIHSVALPCKLDTLQSEAIEISLKTGSCCNL
ncbi:unnamed protein product [Dimorphilus gyrociliatus]|uniref:Uncharacterized protein n=1 Tax=Dimorphilus gyrociliatus TaxID=2664684 RepID=A0A7I8WDT9_9ANNE|nr:unnamed protein product [Dimorphilus gyrociliatus]